MAALHYLDYIIFALTLIASFAIGVYHAIANKNKETVDHYLIGNQQMKAIPVSVSLVISSFSAVGVLGDAEEVYFYGVEYWFILFGFSAASILAAHTFVPLLYPLKIKSVNEVSGHFDILNLIQSKIL